MQWLNDNVIGSIPKVDEIVPKSKEIVKAAGVDEAKPIKTAKSVREEKARESLAAMEKGRNQADTAASGEEADQAGKESE